MQGCKKRGSERVWGASEIRRWREDKGGGRLV